MIRKLPPPPFLLILVLFVGEFALAQIAVPRLTQRVTDETVTLTSSERSNLESRLKDFEQEHGSQIAILIVPTTQPEALEQYSMRVVEQWKLGRAGIDDGVLLLIAKDDRKIRIEVGYGLEGAIPDAYAKRIVDQTITPHFKKGQFYQGIQSGILSLMALIKGEPLPAPSRSLGERPLSFVDWIVFAALFGLPLAPATGQLLEKLVGRPVGTLLIASSVFLFAWIFLSWELSVLISLIFTIISFLSTRSVGSGRGLRGGGSFSGGFGGGGGSFGGGGASGGW